MVALTSLLLSLSITPQATSRCDQRPYVNRNDVDRPPLTLQQVRGVIDFAGMGNLPSCAAVFSADGKIRISVATPDGSGQFVFSKLPPGEYRLVVFVDPYCPANQTVRVAERAPAAEVEVKLRLAGQHDCSEVVLKRKMQ